MMAVEAVKEKFYCFLGIVHPTYYQSRGWGTWLDIAHCIIQFVFYIVNGWGPIPRDGEISGEKKPFLLIVLVSPAQKFKIPKSLI